MNAGNEPVHLIAHSMGGLDSRYMISWLDMADQGANLDDNRHPASRHPASPIGASRASPASSSRCWKHSASRIQTFYDLTRASCKAFNEKTPDVPSVRYFSVAGRHDGHFLHPEWLLPYGIVKEAEGDNDGIVAVESAKYGEQFDIWEGDHLRLVNWYHPAVQFRGNWHDPAAALTGSRCCVVWPIWGINGLVSGEW